jgi:periplasmic protein TonB
MEKIVKLTGSIKPPRALYTPPPKYSTSKKQGSEGTVVVAVTVGSNGQVSDPQIVRSLGPSLDANVIEAVKTWKFAPATKDGFTVAVRINIEITMAQY